MIRHAIAILMLVQPAELWAQAADLPLEAASGDPLPPGVSVKQAGSRSVYVDAHGRTLYGMDMRAVTGRTGRQALWCSGDCLTQWEPLMAPAKAMVVPLPPQFGGEKSAADASKPNGDWVVMQGPKGPQWVFKGVNLVFTRIGEQPGSAAHDGEDGLTWNSLKYVPPLPRITAPANVAPRLVEGRYLLVDGQGDLLVSPRAAHCGATCAQWRAFPAGLVRRGTGQWSVRQDEERAQWVYRDRPVYVIDGADPADIPTDALPLTP
ncbi:hypothetical protein MOK15_21705 [Sphingobium sp. BYY-5]|uniref:hypothetical protein n=1 Tax=Sphingobium sp. BYY-5 TaxID=2926400 RepID=UPI001FA79B96|nr:hypothetical protein [Sphingobium sp. BYY-5]MCI4592677.1 hypothetical protein [Sphingobium sp. BYY-5]